MQAPRIQISTIIPPLFTPILCQQSGCLQSICAMIQMIQVFSGLSDKMDERLFWPLWPEERA
ncbi:hypothetical protein AL013_13730 [Mariprofundus ferrooxydans]|uniref:Uncharacterized protein n=1 Tax=Mariprofundus ferrooxydans PV-1 TaxID=314345 RepID=Q0F095_9PROT|nr:hypothetical protein SPV1_08848 [Mariprofundus ferrooxydans PV-1]KON46348.1 hypothetical protein AL013_13730 [Mariprofundus ferrooxydans]